ncbi:MAG: tRNA (guanosine(37)-N1)-methyltransferase TrmD [Candidatus Paceibacterota bacterium]|jgi:tRNA (guanine37-N1)-methyltransferase
MKIDVLTIFPDIFSSYLGTSFIKKAQDKKILEIRLRDIRQSCEDARKSVDDRPFGGGLGMVLKVEPILKTLKKFLKLDFKGSKIKIAGPLKKGKAGLKEEKTKIILFTPRGRQFTQKMAYRLSKMDRLVMICGRYEGVDERVAKNIADMEISIGPYDLMGGEIPAMAAIESIARLIPGVLGKEVFLKERISKRKGFIEGPQYTRPEIFDPGKIIKGKREPLSKPKLWRVPKVLLSGDHKKIGEWKKDRQKDILE